MATYTKVYRHNTLRISLTKSFDAFIDRFWPRRCMAVSAGLFLVGLSIPVLMFFQIIPLNFAIGAIGLFLTACGGILMLIYCGEI